MTTIEIPRYNKLLCGNWKMKLSLVAACDLTTKLVELSSNLLRTDIWLAPSFTALKDAASIAKDSRVKVGAQNVHWEVEGAYTGEISVPMLKEMAVAFSIIGHSERRHIFNESFSLCAKRAIGALEQDFIAMFCLGETLEERKSGNTQNVIRSQMEPLLNALNKDGKTKLLKNLIFAYEPVWAIGTGIVANVNDIEQAHFMIASYWDSYFESHVNKDDTLCPPILYGGSVSSDNIKEVLRAKLVSGALIGGASLKYESMKKMVEISEGLT